MVFSRTEIFPIHHCASMGSGVHGIHHLGFLPLHSALPCNPSFVITGAAIRCLATMHPAWDSPHQCGHPTSHPVSSRALRRTISAMYSGGRGKPCLCGDPQPRAALKTVSSSFDMLLWLTHKSSSCGSVWKHFPEEMLPRSKLTHRHQEPDWEPTLFPFMRVSWPPSLTGQWQGGNASPDMHLDST